MEKVPKRSIFHVIIEKKVSNRRQGVSVQADYVSVSDASYGLEFCLKLTQVVLILVVESLDSNRSGSFQSAFVDCARSTVSNNELLVEILCYSHDVIECVNRHVHAENH